MSHAPDQRFEPSPRVLFQEVHGEMVLLDLESEHYFGLNEVGARFWQLLAQGLGTAEIVDRLLQEYEVERSALNDDLAALQHQLLSRGLIVERSAD
jgi:hypothetical protein